MMEEGVQHSMRPQYRLVAFPIRPVRLALMQGAVMFLDFPTG